MSKVAIVTGSSKGIGAATAIAFARAGYDVVVNYASDEVSANEVVSKIKQLGRESIAVKADVFTSEGVKYLFEVVKTRFESLDVLVNNAGYPEEAQFGYYTFDEISKSLNNNFSSSVLCTQEAVKQMTKGCVLFTSSIYGLQFGGNPGLALYSAGKAAMINFAQTMAEKLSPNIRCNVVAPGTTKTPAWDGVSHEYSQKSLDMNLIKEWVDPDEIADAFIFLAETPHITGQTIVIDGGWQKKIRENSPKRNI